MTANPFFFTTTPNPKKNMLIKIFQSNEKIRKIIFSGGGLPLKNCAQYINYDQSWDFMNAQSRHFRRKFLSLSFALKCLKNDQHRHLFRRRLSPYYKLRNIVSFGEPVCHTQRYKSSPLPYLTSLLNEHFASKRKTSKNQENTPAMLLS